MEDATRTRIGALQVVQVRREVIAPDHAGEHHFFQVGTLDDPSLFDGPKMAIYTVDKQPYHHVPEGVPAFERLPQR